MTRRKQNKLRCRTTFIGTRGSLGSLEGFMESEDLRVVVQTYIYEALMEKLYWQKFSETFLVKLFFHVLLPGLRTNCRAKLCWLKYYALQKLC